MTGVGFRLSGSFLSFSFLSLSALRVSSWILMEYMRQQNRRRTGTQNATKDRYALIQLRLEDDDGSLPITLKATSDSSYAMGWTKHA